MNWEDRLAEVKMDNVKVSQGAFKKPVSFELTNQSVVICSKQNLFSWIIQVTLSKGNADTIKPQFSFYPCQVLRITAYSCRTMQNSNRIGRHYKTIYFKLSRDTLYRWVSVLLTASSNGVKAGFTNSTRWDISAMRSNLRG